MVKAIFKKEMSLYFLTPFGYIFLGFFLLASGIVFTIYNIIGAKSDLYGMFGALNYICLFIFPILTMRIWAEEKKNYTDRLLATSPIRIRSVIVGKYLAALMMLVIALVVTGIYSIIVLVFSQLPVGTILASYLGFFFLSAAYISICFFGASLVNSQISSVIVSFGLLVVFLLIGFLAGAMPNAFIREILDWFSIVSKFDQISIGVLKIGPIYYYASIVVFFLFLSISNAGNRQKYINDPEQKTLKQVLSKVDPIVRIGLVFCVLAITNLIADELPWSYDMTTDKMFTLSDYSHEILEKLDDPIDIVVLAEDEKNNTMISELLGEYKKANPEMINLVFLDADKDPIAAREFDRNNQGLANGSILFESGNNSKVVHEFELVKENEFAPGKSFDGERLFTGAVLFVTAQTIPKVLFSEGHQEDTLENELFQLKGRIESEAHIPESIHLATDFLNPENALIMPSPKRDLDTYEAEALEDYLSSGGRMMVLLDLLNPESELDKLIQLLERYGIRARSNFVVEEQVRGYYANNKMVLVPEYSNSEIVDTIRSRNLSIVLPYAGNLQAIEDVPENLTITPLLFTSDKSWIRYDWDDASEQKSSQDLPGPAVLAYSVEIDNTDLKNPPGKLIVIHNGEFINDEILGTQANFDFFMNSLNWLEDRQSTLTIRPKVIDANRLVMPGITYILLITICALVVPVLFFVFSISVHLKRKNL